MAEDLGGFHVQLRLPASQELWPPLHPACWGREHRCRYGGPVLGAAWLSGCCTDQCTTFFLLDFGIFSQV